jgi:hypothetical protein
MIVKTAMLTAVSIVGNPVAPDGAKTGILKSSSM